MILFIFSNHQLSLFRYFIIRRFLWGNGQPKTKMHSPRHEMERRWYAYLHSIWRWCCYCGHCWRQPNLGKRTSGSSTSWRRGVLLLFFFAFSCFSHVILIPYNIQWSPDGKLLLFAASTGIIHIYDSGGNALVNNSIDFFSFAIFIFAIFAKTVYDIYSMYKYSIWRCYYTQYGTYQED